MRSGRQGAETVLDLSLQAASGGAGEGPASEIESELPASVADEVEHRETGLVIGESQAEAELLEEHRRALGRPKDGRTATLSRQGLVEPGPLGCDGGVVGLEAWVFPVLVERRPKRVEQVALLNGGEPHIPLQAVQQRRLREVRRPDVSSGVATESDDSVTEKGLPGHPEDVGKSITRRGEDVVKQEGKGKGSVDLGTNEQSNRPAGGSTAEAMTGVDPQDPITDPGEKFEEDTDDVVEGDKAKKVRRA